jgi:uncharacterized FlaG/YvyC family protein
LQVIYESVQDLGYTEYTVLKMLERLSTQLDEVRKLAQEHAYEAKYSKEEYKERYGEVVDQIGELSEQIEKTLKDLHVEFNEDNDLLKNSEIILLASRQVLAGAGFDPDTGVKNSEIDQDWKKFKKAGKEFLLTLFFAAISAWLLTEYSNVQKAQQAAQQAAVQQATQELKQEHKSITDELEKFRKDMQDVPARRK